MTRFLTAFVALLAFAPAAHAGGSSVVFGAAEDRVRSATAVESEAEMGLLRLAGFKAVRITSFWVPGLSEPTPHEAMVLANVGFAATLHGVRVYVSVYHEGSRTTPLTLTARKEFASYAAAIVRDNPGFRDVIVGNEPNINRFWMPQFDVRKKSASAPAYLRLLAATYDALKAAAPDVRVWGGALAPRGIDRPNSGRDTISPTRFLRELGEAYRKSGRALPIMDGFSFHPYPLNSSVAVDAVPNDADHLGLIDQDRLVNLLGKAFDGTAQVGSGMPILYDEFGIESVIPAHKRALYGGFEPTTTRPVSEAAQAAAYRRAIHLAYCQSNVAGMLLFHTHDEVGRPGWQSGLVYADGTPKQSLAPVRSAMEEASLDTIGVCPLVSTAVTSFVTRDRTISLRCHRDCNYRAVLERLPLVSSPADRFGAGARSPPSASRSRSAAAPRPAGTGSRCRWCTRRGPGKPLVRTSVPFAVRDSPPRLRSSPDAAAMGARFWLGP